MTIERVLRTAISALDDDHRRPPHSFRIYRLAFRQNYNSAPADETDAHDEPNQGKIRAPTDSASERSSQLRRRYFFKVSGRTAASGTTSSIRPASSAITKASGTFGFPVFIP